MLYHRNIIIFGDDWGRYPSTIQHIGKVLAKENRILWVGSLGLRKPEVSFYDLRRIWEKGKRILGRNNEDRAVAPAYPNVTEVHPFILPFHDSDLVYRWNMDRLVRHLKSTMDRLSFRRPIVITSMPIVDGVIGRLGESSAHYLCLDDFTLFDRAFDSLGAREQRLVQKVDSCFAISETLMKSRRVAGKHNYFLPQGVDTSHFAPSPAPVHPDIPLSRKPVVGFFGILTTWVDLELMTMAARRYPDVEFVVLGKTTVATTIFDGIPNLHYRGPIPFAELPEHARGFDVGIIPFVVNDLTIACNPLKLLEYLSLGIPVVSTDLPEVRKMEPHVLVARDREEFLSMIPAALAARSDAENQQRRSFAEQYSWISITERISDVIEHIESEKSGQ